jgi:hypothetical protein
MTSTSRICHRCLIEKDVSEYYSNSKKERYICKQCEMNYPYKKELYYCEICSITIRKTYVEAHLLTRTHLRSKVTGQTNIHKAVNGQCLRRS